MKRGTIAMIIAGGLCFVAALVWRDMTSAPRGRVAGEGRPAEAKMIAYDNQIESLSRIDDALILYRETGALVPGDLQELAAVAVDAADRIYVGGGTAVVVIAAQGDVIRRIHVEGSVSCLAVDPDGRLYVGLGHAVHRFEANGTPAGVLCDLGPDAIITSLAVAGGAVFVADARRRTVHRFSRDGSPESVIDGKTGLADEPGFVVPSPYFDMMPGQGGTLWIVNPGMHRLEDYNLNGERIAVWPQRSGMGVEDFCGCCNPTHIARLSDGSIITSEKGLARIKEYTSRGRFTGVVATPEQFDRHELGRDLAVDSNDRILVADPARRQVRVFERRK